MVQLCVLIKYSHKRDVANNCYKKTEIQQKSRTPCPHKPPIKTECINNCVGEHEGNSKEPLIVWTYWNQRTSKLPTTTNWKA